MASLTKPFVTPEEYLAAERKAEFKSEYFNGEVFAMSGASRRHNLLLSQLHGLVWQHLRGERCLPFLSDMRVLVQPSGLYAYPDLSVVCEEPEFSDAQADALLNPALIVEILSPSTEAYDRGKKARLYREMPSLKEYLLIAQDGYEVELQRRSPDGGWTVLNASGQDSSIELLSIGYTLSLRELYEPIAGESSGS